MSKTVSACILVIGNEILSGRTKDSNIHFLSCELTKLGIQVQEARVIPDDKEVIIDTLNKVRKTYDYVFTTGGIGPTHDDITTACVCEAMGYELIRNPQAVEMLKTNYANPEDLNEARLKMAETPKGAILVENPISKAPGYQIENVFVLAGVPRIAQAMFEQLKDRLTGGAVVHSQTISTNLVEGILAHPLGDLQQKHATIEIGSYPYFKDGQLGVSLVLRATDTGNLELCAQDVKEMVASLGGNITLSS